MGFESDWIFVAWEWHRGQIAVLVGLIAWRFVGTDSLRV